MYEIATVQCQTVVFTPVAVGGAVECGPIKEEQLHTSLSLTRAASVAEMKLIFSVVAVLALCGTLTHSAAVSDNDVSGTRH